MLTDPDATPEQWAQSLDADDLADQLERLATDKHVFSDRERKALLRECASVMRLADVR